MGGAKSTKRSALDAPAHTTLKFRAKSADDTNDKNEFYIGKRKGNEEKNQKGGEMTISARREALKRSLLELEQQATIGGTNHRSTATAQVRSKILQATRRPIDPEIEQRAQQRLLKQTEDVDEVAIKAKYDDSDDEDDDNGDDDAAGGNQNDDNDSNKRKEGAGRSNNEDSDLDAEDSDLDVSNSSSDEDEDDDEAALQAELDKIRAEREEASRKAAQAAAAEENAKQEEAAILGNPLLNVVPTGTGKMKRKWNDDVVFRNQAKGEPAVQKRFINDTVRNDFHKRFLNKYIR